MDETNNQITAQENEMRNLLGQIGDVDAKRAASLIDDDERIELNARRMAYLTVLAKNEAGEVVTDEGLAAILDDARTEAAKPTQEEVNAADIAYLMMIGGEE